jgi:hypothetical protein
VERCLLKPQRVFVAERRTTRPAAAIGSTSIVCGHQQIVAEGYTDMRLASVVSALTIFVVFPALGAALTPVHPATTFGAAQSLAVRTLADLRSEVRQQTAPAALQVRLRWITDDPVENPSRTGNRFDVVSVERVQSRVRPDRSPQVGSTSLIIVSQDHSGQELDWRVVADPRVVRSEGETSPVLSGRVLYYLDADLRLLLPDLPGITRLTLYKVRSQRGATLLDPIAAIDLPFGR